MQRINETASELTTYKGWNLKENVDSFIHLARITYYFDVVFTRCWVNYYFKFQKSVLCGSRTEAAV